MPDLLTVSVISAAFLLAGTVKGVIGLGPPTVSLGVLAMALDLATARHGAADCAIAGDERLAGFGRARAASGSG